ncbi:N-formylglutamate amidohydrolase [mine drainage metagenome]|uniref:N-formylglutamate amidohydrolase n=1 Tax=mine drainage metagenome TaxID=410659 RepID=A0A1J5SED3_9ZZZZ
MPASFFPFPAPIRPVHCLNGARRRPLLLVCDHASPLVPPDLDGLGLPEAERLRHIGWDPGAAALTAALARRLRAPALLAGVSRLVIDCNRPPGHPTSICAESDGTAIPGNQGLDAAARRRRAAAWYEPYHQAIAAELARLESEGGSAALVAVHSFTPCLNGGAPRPWPVGVLWNRDGRLALPLIRALRGQGLHCGDNEPYSGRVANHTLDRHAQAAGRLHVSLEIRQSDLAEQAQIAAWADCLAALLEHALAEAGLADCAE